MILSFVADLVHVWAAAVWLGGLFALALSFWEIQRVEPGSRTQLSARLARRFSRVALVAVLLITASGLARALVELTSVQQLWQLSYGRAILVKTGLLLALLVVAWFNRFRLLPRLTTGGGSARAGRQLGSTALVELALLMVVVGAVAVLTDLRPGRTLAHASSSPAVTSFPLR